MRKNKQEIILLKNLLTKIFGFSRIIKEEKKDKSKNRRGNQKMKLIEKNNKKGITLIALVITNTVSYDKNVKCCNM